MANDNLQRDITRAQLGQRGRLSDVNKLISRESGLASPTGFDQLAIDIRLKHGKAISRAEIIRALVEAVFQAVSTSRRLTPRSRSLMC